MRVRTLKSMNNLNMMLTIYLGYMTMLSDKIDKKLLFIMARYRTSRKNKTITVSPVK